MFLPRSLWFQRALIFFIVSVWCCGVEAEPNDALISASLTYEYGSYSCESQTVTALLTVVASKTTDKRPVLSLTSVMDVSGSMGTGNRMDLLQGTNDFLVRELSNLHEPHKFGTVTFSSSARELTKLTKLTPDVEKEIEEKINGTRATGGTNLLEGIKRGVAQQTRDDDTANYVRVVFVFTDGIPTEGTRDSDMIVAEVKNLIKETPGLFIYTFGFGNNLKFSLLKGIADAGGGLLYIISEDTDMPKAFGAALGGLLTEVAMEITYTLTPKAGTEILKVRSGGTSVRRGKEVEVYLGDMFLEERRDVVISILLDKICHKVEPLTIEGNFTDPVTAKKVEQPVETEDVERTVSTPTNRTELTEVGAQKLRFDISDELAVATALLAAKDVQGCIKKLDEIQKLIEGSGYAEEQALIKDIRDDVTTLKKQLQAKPTADVEKVAEMEGLHSAVGQQRSAETDEKFKTVTHVTTTAKERTQEKATASVLHIYEPPDFVLALQDAVSAQTVNGTYTYVDVVLTIGAPDFVEDRPPLSLVFVLDVSGSMEGEAFELLIETQKRMIDWLADQNSTTVSLGVILFADKVQELQSLARMDGIDVDKLKKSLESVKSGGETNLTAALKQGVAEQISAYSCYGAHAVFLLTDGVPSSGRDQIVPDLKKQLDATNASISIFTFGLGKYDPELLNAISAVGNGERYILKNDVDIAYSFGDAAGGLMNVFAREIDIKLVPASPGVEIVSTFPKGTSQSGGAVNITLSNLIVNEKHDIFVSLRFPSSSVPTALFNASISYRDPLLCGLAQKANYTVGIEEKDGQLAKKRQLEKDVASILARAIEACLSGKEIETVISIVSKAIDIVAGITYIEGTFSVDLHIDLVSLQLALEEVIEGTMSRADACALIEALKDLLETQRAKGTGKAIFRVQKFYDSESRKQGRFKLGTAITHGPNRPAEDPFTLSYRQSAKEISADSQNVSIDVSLDAIVKSTEKKPSTVVYIVDTSAGVTADSIQIMKTIVTRTWTAYSKSTVFKTSSICIIFYGAKVKITLSPVLFSSIAIADIESLFVGIKAKGDGVILEAFSTGFDVLKKTQKEQDMILVPFVGHDLDDTTASSDAESFRTKLVKVLGFPVTCAPILLPGVKTTYFDSYPIWVTRSTISVQSIASVDHAFDTVRSHFLSTASKRVYIDIRPTPGIILRGIKGGVLIEKGQFLLPDIPYGKKTTVSVQLDIDDYHKPQILFASSFTYFDMRTLSVWKTETRPLIVQRIERSVLKERVDIRAYTQSKLVDVRTAILDGKYEQGLAIIGECIAAVSMKESTDSIVVAIQQQLEMLIQDIYDVFDEKKTREDLLKAIKSIGLQLSIRAIVSQPIEVKPVQQPTVTTLSKKKKEEEPVRVEPSVPPRVEHAVDVEFDSQLTIDEDDQYVTIPYVVEAPESSGILITGHAAIVVDTSATAQIATTISMVAALLEALSGRRAKRSVEIFAWNEKLVSVFSSDDFSKDDVTTALRAVRGVSLSGQAKYRTVVDDGIEKARATTADVVVLYWITTSDTSETDLPKLLQSATGILEDSCANVTIFSYSENLKQSTFDFLTELSRMSGGKLFKLDLTAKEASKRAIETRHADVARASVAWMDSIYTKSIDISLAQKGIGTVQKIVADDKDVVIQDNNVRIPSLLYGEKVTVQITIQLGASSDSVVTVVRRLLEENSLTPLLGISGGYYDVRRQNKAELKPQLFKVEPVTKETLRHISVLESVWKNSANETMKRLGHNDIEGAILSVSQSRFQGQFSRIKDRASVQDAMRVYQSIENKLDLFKKNRTLFENVVVATNLLGGLRPNDEYLLDDGSFLQIQSGPFSVTEEKTVFMPEIGITIPEMNTTASLKDIVVTVLLDGGAYHTLIDREVTLLRTQTAVVEDVVSRLVIHHGYSITLTLIEYRSETETEYSPLRVTMENVGNLREYLNKTMTFGYPAAIRNGLETGLESLISNANSSERVLLLFSASFSECVLAKPNYLNIMEPYITHPINPIKVLTYIVGPADKSNNDAISALSGGSRFYINCFLDVENAVQDSINALLYSIARGVRVVIDQPSWMKQKVKLMEGGMDLNTTAGSLVIALPDLVNATSQRVQLQMELDAWKGDADVISFTVSYFRMDIHRWYKTSSMVLRIRRAPDIVVKAREDAKQVVGLAISKAANRLAQNDGDGAANELFKALQYLDQSPYQDDSFIASLIEYLNGVYNDLINELHVKSAGGSAEIRSSLLSQGSDLGLEPIGSDEGEGHEYNLNVVVRSIIFFSVLVVLYAIALCISRF